MRSSTVLAFFAGSATAQSTAVVVNPLMPASTLTEIGSSSGTTTYVNSCPDGTGIPASYFSETETSSAVRSAGTVVMTPISAPSTTAPARLRRQDNFLGFCEPITLKQGSSSMELHMEDPSPGVWTADMNCAWKGEMTSADLTCTVTNTGSFAKTLEAEGISSMVLKADELAEASVFQTVNVVQSGSNSVSVTSSATSSASASASASNSGSAANATTSGSGAPPQATGAAAGSLLSSGVIAFAGGAAGVFAAALAL